jgi:hypothetical protein
VSVRHAMLALLSEGPKYGLQLREEFEARTGDVWPLNVGQVYTTDLSSPPRDELVMKILIALRVPDASVPEIIQVHRRYLVQLMQQWTHIKEESDPADLNLVLAVDAELFRLDSVVRWLDTADARIKRAGTTDESPFANRATGNASRPAGAVPEAETDERWPLPRHRAQARTRR